MKRGPSKGMQLGKAKKGANDFLDSLRAEGEIVQDDVGTDPSVSTGPVVPQVPTEPVSIVVEEKLRVVLNKNGGLEDMEINGTVFLQVNAVSRQRYPARHTAGLSFSVTERTFSMSLVRYGVSQLPRHCKHSQRSLDTAAV